MSCQQCEYSFKMFTKVNFQLCVKKKKLCFYKLFVLFFITVQIFEQTLVNSNSSKQVWVNVFYYKTLKFVLILFP